MGVNGLAKLNSSKGSHNINIDEDDNATAKSFEEYNVEKVLDKRFVNGRAQYMIKWAGYADSENTWEPMENINCVHLLAECEAELYAKKHLRGKQTIAPEKLNRRKEKTNVCIELSSGSERELSPSLKKSQPMICGAELVESDLHVNIKGERAGQVVQHDNARKRSKLPISSTQVSTETTSDSLNPKAQATTQSHVGSSCDIPMTSKSHKKKEANEVTGTTAKSFNKPHENTKGRRRQSLCGVEMSSIMKRPLRQRMMSVDVSVFNATKRNKPHNKNEPAAELTPMQGLQDLKCKSKSKKQAPNEDVSKSGSNASTTGNVSSGQPKNLHEFSIKKRSMPVGIERGWKLMNVFHKFVMWGETFYCVRWEGVEEPEAVRREDIIDLYPELVIKYYEGLKIRHV
ncbi:M-phase phosphoprotein 8 [Scaptodrosophila lebanonensis]|uniref:M-phase phosphoprotein 8 n=1 Tax=Drosophila lebanonensis TaxID=7225 RepID=A0A6J2T2P9_DROLE|nr:M-phase phosphoprotein 8 [Scaptodrosophila lebanonensis]